MQDAIVPTIMVSAFIFFVVLFAILIKNQEKYRLARLEEFYRWAANNGFQVLPNEAEAPEKGFWESLTTQETDGASFEGLQPFGLGHSRRIEPLACKVEGNLRWYAFDYEYKITTSRGKSTTTTTYYNSVLALRLPVHLPKLTLQPQHLGHNIGKLLGAKELTLESEEFNKAFYVTTSHDRKAYDILHPKTLEFLLARTGRMWQTDGHTILRFERGVQLIPAFEQMYIEVRGFFELLPEYYLHDQKNDILPAGPESGQPL